MRVRPATPADRAALARLRAALWPDPGTDHESELDAVFDPAHEGREQVALVVERGGTLVAFAEVSMRDHAERCASTPVGYLEGWYVEAAHRRRGVGRALLDAAQAWARERGGTELASDAALDDETGRRAHLACGFEDVGAARLFRKSIAPRSDPRETTHYVIVEDYRDAGAVYRRVRERGRLLPDGLRYVSSWVTPDVSRCYQ